MNIMCDNNNDPSSTNNMNNKLTTTTSKKLHSSRGRKESASLQPNDDGNKSNTSSNSSIDERLKNFLLMKKNQLSRSAAAQQENHSVLVHIVDVNSNHPHQHQQQQQTYHSHQQHIRSHHVALSSSSSSPLSSSTTAPSSFDGTVMNSVLQVIQQNGSFSTTTAAAAATHAAAAAAHLCCCGAEDDYDEWKPVMERIRTHPEEIFLQTESGGQNAIHSACVRYPPTRVIRAMLEYAPDAALQQSFKGETPLHIASYGASEEVQELLVRRRPQAACIPDVNGDLPLHYAAKVGATPRLVEHHLFAYPEGICARNNLRITPFWLLPRSYLEANDLEEILEDENEDYYDDWNLLVLFLRYAAYGKNAWDMSLSVIEDYESWMLHAAAACPACPQEVLRFLCKLFPMQALKPDICGNTPLLLSCRMQDIDEPVFFSDLTIGLSGGSKATKQDISPQDIDEEISLADSLAPIQTSDAVFVLEALSRVDSIFDNSVDIILKCNPQAAQHKDKQGRFPLAIALENGKPWSCIKSLIKEYPQVLECQDKPSGKYMFQLAALHSPDLETVFELIRANPEYLQYVKTTTTKRPLDAESEEDKSAFVRPTRRKKVVVVDCL